MTGPAEWFVTRAGPDTCGPWTPRIFCFPHAGGSASYYHPLARQFSPVVDVFALQYPGRQDRRHEACLKSIDTLADKITEQLRKLDDKPTLLFGHSMGATLAFEVAWRLEESGRTTPLRVISSGRIAPGLTHGDKIHQRDDAGVIAEVRNLNGTGASILADDEILRMSLPAIRGDYQAIETYSYTPGRILRCPITALSGDSDPRTRTEDAEAWRAYTQSGFRTSVFPGGHFYLAYNIPAVAAEIAKDLEQMISAASPNEPSPAVLLSRDARTGS